MRWSRAGLTILALALVFTRTASCSTGDDCRDLAIAVEPVRFEGGTDLDALELRAIVTENGEPVADVSVTFRFGNQVVGTTTSGTDGLARYRFGSDVAQDFVFAATALRADDYTAEVPPTVFCSAQATAPFDLVALPAGVQHDELPP